MSAKRSGWTLRRVDRDFDDDLSDLDIPPDQRIAVVWKLSQELYHLGMQNGGVYDEQTETLITKGRADVERRLPRASLRLRRR